MTNSQFASLGPSIFAVVVAKRQAHVAATKLVDDLMDACTCDRGCQCELREQTKAAKIAEGRTYHDLRVAEESYREYTDIRYDRQPRS